MAMLTGCVQSVFFPGVNAATQRVLVAEGCAVDVRPCRGLRCHQKVRDQAHTQDQRPGRRNTLQKTTPAYVQDAVAHAFSPAAALIAARIRW